MRLREVNDLRRLVIKIVSLSFVSGLLLAALSGCQLVSFIRPTQQIVVVKEEMSLEEAMTLVAEATLGAGGVVNSGSEPSASGLDQTDQSAEQERLSVQLETAAAESHQADAVFQKTADRLSTAQSLVITQTQVIRQRTLQPVSTLAFTATPWPSPVATNPTTFFRNTFTPLPTQPLTPTPSVTFTPTPIPPGLPGLQVQDVKRALEAAGINRCKEESDGWVDLTICEAQTADNKDWYYVEIYSVPKMGIFVNNIVMAVFQSDPRDQVALDKLRAIVELNYENADPQAARSWLEQNLPSLNNETDKRQKILGGVKFVLYGPKNGIRLEVGAPPPYPTPPG